MSWFIKAQKHQSFLGKRLSFIISQMQFRERTPKNVELAHLVSVSMM